MSKIDFPERHPDDQPPGRFSLKRGRALVGALAIVWGVSGVLASHHQAEHYASLPQDEQAADPGRYVGGTNEHMVDVSNTHIVIESVIATVGAGLVVSSVGFRRRQS